MYAFWVTNVVGLRAVAACSVYVVVRAERVPSKQQSAFSLCACPQGQRCNSRHLSLAYPGYTYRLITKLKAGKAICAGLLPNYP